MNNSLNPETPLVSIVTPSYNSMPYLEKNIQSVLDQHYPNLEHIIIDGGSTDGSLEILRSYNHLNWISEKDRGQSHALNKGFRKANGEIIGWLNSDDLYEPYAINSIVKYLIENPKIDIVYGNINIIDENGNKIGVSRSKPFNARVLLSHNMVKQPAVFMRSRVIDELGGVDEQLNYVMDRELWLRAGVAGFQMEYYEKGFLADFRICPGTKSFENAELFSKEWATVLEKALKLAYFQSLSLKVKGKIINENRAVIFYSLMLKAIENNNKLLLVSNFWKSIYYNNKLVTNLGAWRVFIFGLFGRKPDKLRRYRRQ